MSLLYRDPGLVKMMHLGGDSDTTAFWSKKAKNYWTLIQQLIEKVREHHVWEVPSGSGNWAWPDSTDLITDGSWMFWGTCVGKLQMNTLVWGFLMLTLFTSVREIEGSKACKWATILEELKIRSTCVASLYKLNIFLKVLIQSKQGFDSKLNKLHFYWY